MSWRPSSGHGHGSGGHETCVWGQVSEPTGSHASLGFTVFVPHPMVWLPSVLLSVLPTSIFQPAWVLTVSVSSV